MQLTEIKKTVADEMSQWAISLNVELEYLDNHENHLAATLPIPKQFDSGIRGFTYKITFYTDHWGLLNKYDDRTESGAFWTRKSLVDTVRHELAHVYHINACLPQIRKSAERFSGPDFDPICLIGGYRRTMTGLDSAHGPEWKKWARLLNATPFAHSRY